MDGEQARLSAAAPRHSVERQLLWALAIAISVIALLAGTFSFFSAFDEAEELQDDVLYQIAVFVRQQGLSPHTAAQRAFRLEDEDFDSWVYVRLLRSGDDTSAVSDGRPLDVVFAAPLENGLHTVATNRGPFRVLVEPLAGDTRVAVAQTAHARSAIARASAWRTLLPFFVLIPVLLLVVTHLVRTLFRPIASVAHAIDARPPENLRPIPDAAMPDEVRPFVHAINGLLARVADMLAAQRRFIADAAHELRSPLAALSLQAERLEHANLSPTALASLATLRGGIERARTLINQLLSLSRAQAGADAPSGPTALRGVLRAVIEELVPLAQAKDIDLGVTEDADVRLHASALDLATLTKNLVDNAIRYTPAGGRIDLAVAVQGGHPTLRVADSGPGIAPEQRARVFEPFHRILGSGQTGSGLGLAIVQTIAERLGARVELDWTDPQQRSGLAVTVTFATSDGAARGTV